MTVSLTPELESFVSSRVASGKFVSASEVVREGLRLLEEREARRDAELAQLRRDVQVGLEQARAGELVDGEEVLAAESIGDPKSVLLEMPDVAEDAEFERTWRHHHRKNP